MLAANSALKTARRGEPHGRVEGGNSMATITLPPQATAFDTDTTAAAMEERSKYRRHFARFDMFFFLICALVGLDTLGTVANFGPQGFTWMLFLAVFFFLPYGLLTAELGSAFTDEGAPYTWTRMAFGRFVAALNQVPSWLSNPIWLGGTLTATALAAANAFLFPITGVWRYVFAAAFIWFAILSAITSLDVGKWVPTIGGFARMAILALFTATVAIYALVHGVQGFGGGDFVPTYALFIAVIPVLVFNFVGFETPNAAGEELKNPQKDVPVAVARAGIITVLAYGLPVLAILLVLPKSQVTSLAGFLSAMKQVFTVYGSGAGTVLGDIVAVGFIWALATSGTAWIMSADRAQAVAGYDGAAPRFLGRISARFGTPVTTNITTGIVATVFMVLAFAVVGNGTGSLAKYFSVALALAISTTTITYIPMFAAAIVLRYNKYKANHRPYRVPLGNTGMWIAGGLTIAFCVLGTAVTIWPGFGQADPEATLNGLGWGGQRLQYELAEIVPLIIMLGIGVLFYIIAAPTRRKIAVATTATATRQV
jgi:glutamate:GABA antiporter